MEFSKRPAFAPGDLTSRIRWLDLNILGTILLSRIALQLAPLVPFDVPVSTKPDVEKWLRAKWQKRLLDSDLNYGKVAEQMRRQGFPPEIAWELLFPGHTIPLSFTKR